MILSYDFQWWLDPRNVDISQTVTPLSTACTINRSIDTPFTTSSVTLCLNVILDKLCPFDDEIVPVVGKPPESYTAFPASI